jgi:hypothetical protein
VKAFFPSSLPLHSPVRGNATPPLCKLTAYTHAETPDLGLRRRFQRGMILINSRSVLLLRSIANKLKKKRNKMYVQISLVTGTHEQPSTRSIYRTMQLGSREGQISHEISTCITYCDLGSSGPQGLEPKYYSIQFPYCGVIWTNLFLLPKKAGEQAHGASPTSYTSADHKTSECF